MINDSPRCLYSNSFPKFLEETAYSVLGTLCDRYHGNALTTTRDAWYGEILIMKKVLSQLADKAGRIVFEYDIPRLGKRRWGIPRKLNSCIQCFPGVEQRAVRMKRQRPKGKRIETTCHQTHNRVLLIPIMLPQYKLCIGVVCFCRTQGFLLVYFWVKRIRHA